MKLLFSKKGPDPNPKISVQGIEIEFHRELAWWKFSYRGTDFFKYDFSLTLPTAAELNGILEVIDLLKSEIRSRLKKGWEEWGRKIDDGETYSVNLEEFATKGTFSVSYQ